MACDVPAAIHDAIERTDDKRRGAFFSGMRHPVQSDKPSLLEDRSERFRWIPEFGAVESDAEQMLELCEQPIIEKTRHVVDTGGLRWEIDEFDGANRGLVVAEVELDDPDQPIELPDWVGAEVTDDPRYYNANLIAHPYSAW